jgi:GNAT superfamily N-acetyltransferase
MVHLLARLLDEAAHGRFPPPDGSARAFPPLSGPLDALIAFTGTFAVTGSLTQEELDARVPRGEFSIPMSAGFVQWMGERIGGEAMTQDLVLVAISPGPPPEHERALLVDVAESDHSRVARAMRYRRDVRVYETTDRAAVAVLGRGITGRWELAYEVDPDARGAGLGRAIAAAAVRLLPEGTPVWAQVAPGNAASVRAMLGAGFRPVGAEILFVRTPR